MVLSWHSPVSFIFLPLFMTYHHIRLIIQTHHLIFPWWSHPTTDHKCTHHHNQQERRGWSRHLSLFWSPPQEITWWQTPLSRPVFRTDGMTCPSLLVFIKKKKAYSQGLQEDNVLKLSLYCISPPFFFCSGTGPVAYPCPLSRVFIYEAFFVYYELMKRKLLKPMSVGVMKDYKLRDLRASHTLEHLLFIMNRWSES